MLTESASVAVYDVKASADGWAEYIYYFTCFVDFSQQNNDLSSSPIYCKYVCI